MLHWRRDRTAFAISGGGARGAAQVGMLRALIERGISADLIVGVSIGAWNGAWIAFRPQLDWVRQLEQVWRQVSRRTLDMVWWRAAQNMVFFFFSSRRRHTRFDCDWSSDVCSSD